MDTRAAIVYMVLLYRNGLRRIFSADQLVFHFKVVFFGGKGVIVMILVDIKTNRHANIAVMEFSKLDTINRRIL